MADRKSVRGRDSLEPLLPVVYRYEAAAHSAIKGSRRPTDTPNPPILVIAGNALDAWRLADQMSAEGTLVDLLDDTQFAEAVQRAGVGGFDIAGAEAAQMRGMLSALRGAAGEDHVVDALASGSISSPARSVQAVLLPFTEPGADIAFVDGSETVIQMANVKVASSAAVISRHFERHGDTVPIIYASSDAADHAATRGFEVVDATDQIPLDRQVVVDIGRSSADFDAEIHRHLHSADADSLRGVLEAGPEGIEQLADVFPFVSAGMIALRFGMRARAGQPAGANLRKAGKDAVTTTASTLAAKIAAGAAAPEPITVLAAVSAAVAVSSVFSVRDQWAETTRPVERVATTAEVATTALL